MIQDHGHWLAEGWTGARALCLKLRAAGAEQSLSLPHVGAAGRLKVASQSSPGKSLWLLVTTQNFLLVLAIVASSSVGKLLNTPPFPSQRVSIPTAAPDQRLTSSGSWQEAESGCSCLERESMVWGSDRPQNTHILQFLWK